MTRLSCIVNAMVVDGLATLGARASAAIALTVLTKNIPVSPQEDYILIQLCIGVCFASRSPFQCPIMRLIVRSRNISKPRNLYLELSDHSDSLQPHRQQCWCAYQITKRCDKLNYQSRGFETSRDITIMSLVGYWNGTQVVSPRTFAHKIPR